VEGGEQCVVMVDVASAQSLLLLLLLLLLLQQQLLLERCRLTVRLL